MSDTPETLADIVAEIRRGERMFWSLRDCAAYADRIEAAAERERVSAPGNVAAMREVLKESTALLAVVRGDEYAENITRQISRNTDVLASPARNCDRFATAVEAVVAFAGHLRALEDAHGIYSEYPDKPALAAAAAVAWLFDTPKDSAQ